jgi:uncharacterized protein YbjQ (UPF0145 family)
LFTVPSIGADSRLADRGEAWGCGLSVNGLAAIRSVGFEPVGQVFGAAGQPLAAATAVSCPGTTARSQVPGTSAGRITQALYDGYQTAIGRMTRECSDIGGHGIVGASLELTETRDDTTSSSTIAFKVIGTAVRAVGSLPQSRPFTTEMSGPDFARLLRHGWVPAGIALGISVAGLHDLVTTNSGPWVAGNAEVPAYTDLMVHVRQDARSRLEQTVGALGAEGIVVAAMALRVRSDRCQTHPNGTDHFVQAVITGTAIARFADLPQVSPLPCLVLSLNPADPGGQVRAHAEVQSSDPDWVR